MAFCPNCGTPNTDQAEKCVACGFELAVPKQKAKFKGTIMMSGIKAPTAPQTPGAEPTPPPPAQPAAQPPSPKPSQPPSVGEGGKNLAFQKTMLGHAPIPAPAAPPRSPEPAGRSSTDFSQAATVQGPAAQFTPPRAPSSAEGRPDLADTTPGRPTASGSFGASSGGFGASSGGFSASSGGTGSFGHGQTGTPTSGFGGAAVDSTFPPSAPKPNPGKVLALGCAAVLVLSCVIGGLLYFVLADKLKALLAEGAGDSGAEAAAWQASIAQSLAQVTALCQVDCAQASVFFHPRVQSALLGEAKALTPARLQKLSDAAQSKAAMLDGTEDQALATGLGLDPQQCARVVVEGAKVVSCSVPDAGGKPSVLRIVHLSGISSL